MPNSPLNPQPSLGLSSTSADATQVGRVSGSYASIPPVLPDSEVDQSIAATAVGRKPVSSTRDEWIGKDLHQYSIKKWLGGGGMGQVYLAKHHWLDLPVAIKMLNPVLDDEESIKRFRRESILAARLDHPNIVRATDGGKLGDHFFLVTEYLEGCDLNQLVREVGPLDVGDACRIICEACEALAYAHEHQLVHRDIKPSNLMVCQDGSVKLLDLGLARYSNSATQMTATDQFMGTIDYVSPEQAVDTRNVDLRADLYSLGCTFYFLLTGQPPFKGDAYDTVVSKLLAHAEEIPEPISSFRHDVPKDVIRVLGRMLEKSPEDRFQSAAEIAALLLRFSKEKTARVSAKPATGSKCQVIKRRSIIPEIIGLFFFAVWAVVRGLLRTVGILERTAVESTTRLGKSSYRYQLNGKAVVALLFLAGLIYFLATTIEFEVVGPPPNPNMQEVQWHSE